MSIFLLNQKNNIVKFSTDILLNYKELEIYWRKVFTNKILASQFNKKADPEYFDHSTFYKNSQKVRDVCRTQPNVFAKKLHRRLLTGF